ncbi:glycosyltransferase, partial [Opitutales bacterium]|nr:glycosyltransferase [Opitutales bacterium]
MNEDDNIFISVVIPTYERPNDLKICLNSLSKEIQQGAPTYEIIVSDDSKSEESKRMVESDFPNVFWGKGKQNGPAGNRNAGVSRARGKWIVFLDDDCIAQKGYLDAYAKVIQTNSNIQVFEGRIFADRKRRTWAEGCPENEHGGMLWTSNLCVNKSLFFEIGKFDERFKVAYEDVEFAHRLKQRKIKTFFVFDAA